MKLESCLTLRKGTVKLGLGANHLGLNPPGHIGDIVQAFGRYETQSISWRCCSHPSCPWNSHLGSIREEIVAQSLSHVRLFATQRTAAHQASLSFTVSQNLLKLMSIESMMPSNHLILCCPFSSCPESFPASRSFPTGQLFTSGDLSFGAAASKSALPMNIQGCLPLGLISLIFCCTRDSQESSPVSQFEGKR